TEPGGVDLADAEVPEVGDQQVPAGIQGDAHRVGQIGEGRRPALAGGPPRAPPPPAPQAPTPRERPPPRGARPGEGARPPGARTDRKARHRRLSGGHGAVGVEIHAAPFQCRASAESVWVLVFSTSPTAQAFPADVATTADRESRCGVAGASVTVTGTRRQAL